MADSPTDALECELSCKTIYQELLLRIGDFYLIITNILAIKNWKNKCKEQKQNM